MSSKKMPYIVFGISTPFASGEIDILAPSAREAHEAAIAMAETTKVFLIFMRPLYAIPSRFINSPFGYAQNRTKLQRRPEKQSWHSCSSYTKNAGSTA